MSEPEIDLNLENENENENLEEIIDISMYNLDNPSEFDEDTYHKLRLHELRKSRKVRRLCKECGFADLVDKDIRFCPTCGFELEGWND